MTISLDEVSNTDVLEVPAMLEDLLDEEAEAQLRCDLEKIAESRRQAATDGATLKLRWSLSCGDWITDAQAGPILAARGDDT